MNVLIIGSGGREHAIAWKIAQSPLLTQLYIAPGNPGTETLGKNIDLSALDFNGIAEFVTNHAIKLIIVGPEDPLVHGITDFFEELLPQVAVLGPGRHGALLEGSKDFAKQFMTRHAIPTAAYRSFTGGQVAEAMSFIRTLNAPYVIKADGLAAGKGVLICSSEPEAEKVLVDMLEKGLFGEASARVVIEEFLSGIEMSAFVLTDGVDFVKLPDAKDYKRIGEGDTGLNTGGMGSVSPVPFADEAFMSKVLHRIIEPTIEGLKQEDIPYRGFIFFGLMNVAGDPFVIEYNVRLGDPETESILPRLDADLLALCYAAAKGELKGHQAIINPSYSTTVMLVSGGYPESYAKGFPILGLDEASRIANVFHAGSATGSEGEVITKGGRVLAVNAMADSLTSALEKCYAAIERIKFEGSYHRRDIGSDLIDR